MELITKEQAAAIADVSVETIRRWQATGQLRRYPVRSDAGQITDMIDRAELLEHPRVRPIVEVGPVPDYAAEDEAQQRVHGDTY